MASVRPDLAAPGMGKQLSAFAAPTTPQTAAAVQPASSHPTAGRPESPRRGCGRKLIAQASSIAYHCGPNHASKRQTRSDPTAEIPRRSSALPRHPFQQRYRPSRRRCSCGHCAIWCGRSLPGATLDGRRQPVSHSMTRQLHRPRRWRSFAGERGCRMSWSSQPMVSPSTAELVPKASIAVYLTGSAPPREPSPAPPQRERRVSIASAISVGCRPSRIASKMLGASSLSCRTRSTQEALIFSAAGGLCRCRRQSVRMHYCGRDACDTELRTSRICFSA